MPPLFPKSLLERSNDCSDVNPCRISAKATAP
eukprot:Nitzschia sp. Nitz4//scaffold869_size804//653//745//NITZ4_009334-RA/size804-exonerate_est2genome-gene-0.1-mRNA-1//1//CDS//3329559198//6269//frame0